MQLEVLRFNYGKDSTNGMLFEINNGKREFLCYTLEDESREEKVWGETCIPEGEYCLGLRTTGGHQAYFNVYPRIAAVLEKGQDVIIKYTDFSIIE